MRKEIATGIVLALLLAFFISPLASPWPDGLEKVAEDYGFAGKGEEGSVMGALFPDYRIPALANEWLSRSFAGILGTSAIFVIVCGVGLLLKRRRSG